MPRAGWCDQDNSWVWVNDDGSCVNGHGAEHVTRVYDTDTQSAPPPAEPSNAYPPAPGSYTSPAAGGAYPEQPPRQVAGYGGGPYLGPERSNKSVISLILGILALLTSCVPILGMILGIAGLILGILGLKTDKRGLAIAGIVVSVFAIISAIVFALLTAALVSSPEFMQQFEQELNRSIQ